MSPPQHGPDAAEPLQAENSGPPRHRPSRYADLDHFVLPLEQCGVEVVAARVSVRRLPGPTTGAAAAL